MRRPPSTAATRSSRSIWTSAYAIGTRALSAFTGSPRRRRSGEPSTELTVFTEEPGDQIARIRAGEPAFQYETRRRRKDGTIIDVLLTISPWTDNGQLLGATGIAIDLSERKQAERAREQALGDLEEAQRLARIGSWTWDPSGGQLMWSAQMFDIYRRDRRSGPQLDTTRLRTFIPMIERASLSRCLVPSAMGQGLSTTIASSTATGSSEPCTSSRTRIRLGPAVSWAHSRTSAISAPPRPRSKTPRSASAAHSSRRRSGWH